MEKDIHIQILEFGRDNPNFTYSDLVDKFPHHEQFLKRVIDFSQLFTPLDPELESTQFMLSFEDRFRLLEYEELHEARKNAKQAMIIAIGSVLLTLATLIGSMLDKNEIQIVEYRPLSPEMTQIKSQIKNANQ